MTDYISHYKKNTCIYVYVKSDKVYVIFGALRMLEC